MNCHMHCKNSKKFALKNANVGDDLLVSELCGGCSFQQRLMGMGICKGARIKLLKKIGNCSMLVGINGSRYAIGGGMADRILVERPLEACP